jgi:hypothetical protein
MSGQIEQNALETAKSDVSYERYVEKERERRAKRKVEEVQQSVQEDLEEINKEVERYRQRKMKEMKEETVVPENPDLSELTEARVKRVEETNSNYFKIVVETYDGETFSQRLELGLPEDKNEWERLCHYVGVPPQPSELSGEKVPIVVPKDSSEPWIDVKIPPVVDGGDLGFEWGPTFQGHNENKIDVPPFSKGLNPLKYKFRRSIGQKARHSSLFSTGIEKLGRTFPWTGSLGIIAIGFLLMGTTQFSDSLLVIPVAILGFALQLAGGFYAMCAYGRLAVWILVSFLSNLATVYKTGREFLFPSD